MKITKQLEAEIKEVMEDYWNSYFEGKLDHWGNYLVEDYRNIGGTEEEIWNSKTEILDYTNRVMDQMQGTTELRNKQMQIIPYDPYMMVHELLDIYIKIEDEWTFYQKFRLSSLIQKIDGEWKVLHQHGSYPDSKTTEGEAFAFDTLKSENVKLQKAISERTIELEHKNRELEIEAATERVRVQSMAMQHPNDLEKVNKELLHQLTKLKIDGLSGVSFYFVDEDEIVTVWDLSSPGSMNDPNSFSFKFDSKKYPALGGFVEILKTTQHDYFILDFPKTSLLQGIEELKDINITIANALKNAVESGALSHQWNPAARITDGILSIDLMKPPDDDTKTILLKMAGAFNQAYTRFLDLQKAEDQAGEAEIQLALERVRARSLAMHHTSELQEIVKVVAQQLQHMGLNINGGVFITINEELDQDIQLWASLGAADYVQKVFVPLFDRPIFTQLRDAVKKGNNFFDETYSKEEKDEMFHHLFHFSPWNELSKERRDELLSREGGLTRTAAISQNTSIVITNHNGNRFSEQEIDILKRFGSVFEQTYTRFLDLQKAEAQAREAQIELALERVRARTMAMQHSEELQETSLVLFQQLKELGEPAEQCTIGIIKELEGVVEISATLHGSIMQQTFRHKIDEPFVMNKIFGGWKDQQRTLLLELKEEELRKYNQYRNELVGKETFPVKLLPGDRWIIHAAYFSKGMLALSTNESRPAGSLQLLERFAIVFEQTYTRFLDLQKAEAQARDARIETALEKVRSRTMGMRQSHELGDVATVLFKELNQLVENLWTCGFVLCEKDRAEDEWWLSTESGFIPSFYLPNVGDRAHENLYSAWKEGKSFHAEQVDGADLAQHYEWLMKIPVAKKIFDDFESAGFERPVWQKLHGAYFSKGYLCIITRVPCHEEEIFKRFAQVFDLTYTRFLDLQKAEAQAREAQIETALERVRSRSLAMHKSDELNEVVSVVFERLKDLHIPFTAVGIAISIAGSKDLNAFVCGENEAGLVITNYRLPYFDNKISNDFNHVLENQLDYFVGHYSKEEKDAFYTYVLDHTPEFRQLPENIKRIIFDSPSYTVSMMAVNKATFNINDFEGKVLADDEVDIIKRFAKVFDQAYTRFLDLQKAEEQAREARIEAALERVRSRSLAMHTSGELGEVVTVVLNNLLELGYLIDRGAAAHLAIFSEGTKDFFQWTADPALPHPVRSFIPYTDLPILSEFWDAREKGHDFFAKVYSFEEKNTWFNFAFKFSDLKHIPGELKKLLMESETYAHSIALEKNSAIIINSITGNQLSENQIDILRRFSKVFEQAYTRFLDLQNAEAQTREAQIEAALEKARSRSMSMQSSDELPEVANVLFLQIQALGIPAWSCGYNILAEDKQSATCCMSSEGTLQMPFKLRLVGEASFDEWGDFVHSDQTMLVQELADQSLDEHYLFMKSFPDLKPTFDQIDALGLTLPTYQINHLCKFNQGFLLFITYEKVPASHDIFKRFTRVFEQTYTRFSDLKQAEAQAREARIEAALERTRTQSMLMQHSSELDTTLRVFHEQVLLLGIRSAFSFLWLPDEAEDRHIFWAAWRQHETGTNVFKSKSINYPLDREEPATKQCLIDWKSGERVFSYAVPPAGIDDYFAAWKELLEGVEHLTPANFQQGLHYVEAYMAFGCFGVMVLHELGEEEKKLLGRFSIEFERTYTRFLDLQKAEAQARESQIQLAMERIRARTMAMQTSEDLKDAAALLFQQVKALGVPAYTCGYNIWEQGEKECDSWMSTHDGSGINPALKIPLTEDANFIHFVESKKNDELFYVLEMRGERMQEHYQYLIKTIPVFKAYFEESVKAGFPMPETQIHHLANFSYGNLMFITLEPCPEFHDVFKRFAAVFEQTYTRFLDLKKAEAQAREAKIEAAMEKVRGRAMAMQKPDELVEVAQLLRKEMGLLGVEELETSSIYIHNEDAGETECWYAIKDIRNNDNSLVSDHMTIHLKDTWVGSKMLAFQHSRKKQISILMQGENRKEWINYCALHSTLLQGYYGDEIPERTYHLVKSSHGFMGAASSGDISNESWNLLHRATSVFSLAYTRFNDLQKAEAQALRAELDLQEIKKARLNAEKALVELQATQKQLIQSEKMASLGELTAGIAHEIQNPLNFVNNFSEVSGELLQEMQEEIDNNNFDEVKAIALDVKENLSKILHHGKRADGIVKGMLQHSRSDSGKKEMTDINALADEYLRLAYQGLRAKDKSFNATLKTNFDEAIGNINIVPQDIGRVILNLITNAFYAVNEKKKAPTLKGGNYEPTVTVSTKRISSLLETTPNSFLGVGGLQISVSDNGNGIPSHLIDKIFQPFFTTKPTGQGTGLGLSLSYDIIKANVGDLKVETKEGEGSIFIIELPNN